MNDRVEVTQASFFGRQTVNIPIVAMTGVIGGYQKPKPLFFAAIIILIGGISTSVEAGVGAFLGALVLSSILAVFYVLKKEMSLYVQNGGDVLWGLAFKRSVIEGIPVDIEKVNKAIAIINQKVLAIRN